MILGKVLLDYLSKYFFAETIGAVECFEFRNEGSGEVFGGGLFVG